MAEAPRPEALLEALLQRLEAGDVGADEVDENLLAGLLDGTLRDDERELLLRQLAENARLREQAWEVAELGAEPSGAVETQHSLRRAQSVRQPVSVRRPWGLLVGIAAALIVGVYLGTGDLGPESISDPQARLVALVEALRSADPDGLADLKVIDPQAASSPFRAAGLEAVEPRAVVLTGRPTFRWEPADTAGPYTVEVFLDDGEPVFDAQASEASLPFPASAPNLEPGTSYLWFVRTQGDAGADRSEPCEFSVMPESLRQVYGRARTWLEANAPADLVEAAQIQLALHFDLLQVAQAIEASTQGN